MGLERQIEIRDFELYQKSYFLALRRIDPKQLRFIILYCLSDNRRRWKRPF
jgi:hypothetical protein